MFIDEAKLTARLVHPKIAQTFELGKVERLFIRDGVHRRHRCARVAARRRAKAAGSRPIAVYIAHEVLDALDYAHSPPTSTASRSDRASRHLAVERAAQRAATSSSSISASRARRTRIAQEQDRHAQGQVRLHVARAGDRPPARRPLRRVLGRRRARRAAHRPAPVRRGDRARRAADGARRAARAPRQVRRRHRARAQRIVRKALKKDPDERPQTAAELHEQLEDYLFAAGQRVGPNDLRAFAERCSTPIPKRRRTSCSRHAARTSRTPWPSPPQLRRRPLPRRSAKRQIRGRETTVGALPPRP